MAYYPPSSIKNQENAPQMSLLASLTLGLCQLTTDTNYDGILL